MTVEQRLGWRVDRARGPWAITYRTVGTGVRFSRSGIGWAVSGAFRGRGALVGWVRSNEPHSIQVGLEDRLIVVRVQ